MAANHGFEDGHRANEEIAARFLETARLLENRGANPFRVRAYRRAADTLRRLQRSVEQVLQEEGPEGLDRLSDIGPGLAAAIRDYLNTGRMPLQERLTRSQPPFGELAAVPGIGRVLAERLQDELKIATLEELEVAAYDGRLDRVTGIGPRRLEGIRLALAARLGRSRAAGQSRGTAAPVGELLDIDREYRELAAKRRLPTIAPRRMNPRHSAWLPILHTRRGARHYTAMFSNTPRAHQLGRTRDWVVVYFGDDGARGQHTIVTELSGALRGQRVVRGHEAECADHYARQRIIGTEDTRMPA